MNQRDRLKTLITDFCNQKGSRTFSLQELHTTYDDYSVIEIGSKTPQATIRRLLQELRQEAFVSFLDNSGHYTVRTLDLLESEKQDLGRLDISHEKPHKREYILETHARNSQWVKQAKERFGCYCMMDDCMNTFLKNNKQPYIEVHHIIPLHQGGEDGVWNLSVLCAHHHKMAHFAENHIVRDMQHRLLVKAEALLP